MTQPNTLHYAQPERSKAFELIEQLGMLAVLALLLSACLIFVPNFSGIENLKGILLQVSTVGIVSCTMLFCLASGNFDLSVGTVIPCGGVVAAIVTNRTGSYAAGIAAALATGAIVGAVNGLIVGALKINPLITTLATMQMVKTFTLDIADSRAVGVANDSFSTIGSLRLAGLQVPIWIWFACTIFFGVLLDRTTYGRNTLAIGGNEEAARLAGVPVLRTKILIFVTQGIIAAFAGVVLASRMTSGQPKSSEGIELEIIAACVLGGVSLTGGIGKMTFVIAGVLIMGVVQNAMNLLNIDSRQQYAVRGGILLSAVIIDRLKPKR